MYRFTFKGLDIVAISDTHGKHRELIIPNCELLIFLGDCCDFGNRAQIKDFMDWFAEQPALNKLFVAGNHDTCFEQEYDALLKSIPDEVCFVDNAKIVLSHWDDSYLDKINQDPTDIEWFDSLHEEVCIASVPFRMGDMCGDCIDLEDVDILLTHCPPYGVLDSGYGSRKLNEHIEKYKPKYVLFGHNHLTEPQMKEIDGIIYINVTHCKK